MCGGVGGVDVEGGVGEGTGEKLVWGREGLLGEGVGWGGCGWRGKGLRRGFGGCAVVRGWVKEGEGDGDGDGEG